ncbi:hypothetical protein MGN01_36030 [Methylobacterium gnaphalii]|uniref:Uncharacterized protein n=2 Tax=Methylobacterium gnaphalii TaxID=1010610 RepID=A0A512JP91_9HYPH|nr:hypothetical protein MGN01_36030 [Methylobacterium gnaphalii]GLS49607.1 hypothetical protein GCM10007885_24560 [Methylobacterium gnaphalii]
MYVTLILGVKREINVTLTDCSAATVRLPARIVDNSPWQLRAKRAGLSQKELAGLLGVAENTVSLQLRGRWKSGVPLYVQALIISWEMLAQDQRDRLREEMRKIRQDLGAVE